MDGEVRHSVTVYVQLGCSGHGRHTDRSMAACLCFPWIYSGKHLAIIMGNISIRCVTARSSCACVLSWENPFFWTISGLRQESGAFGLSQYGKKAAAYRDGLYRHRWCNGECRGNVRPRVLNMYAPAWFSKITCVSPWFNVFAIKVQAVRMPCNTSNIGEWRSCLEYSGICVTGISTVPKKRRTEWKQREKQAKNFS